jgi:hypothetical protein
VVLYTFHPRCQVRIILELPTESLAAEREPAVLLDCIYMLQTVCGAEIVVSKSGLGGLVEEWLAEHGIPYRTTKSDIQIEVQH